MATNPPKFRAGDTVLHGPSGETWALACDEERGDVMPGGWPESLAKAEDCTLVKSADDTERIVMLTEASQGSGYRVSLARHQLAAEVQDGD